MISDISVTCSVESKCRWHGWMKALWSFSPAFLIPRKWCALLHTDCLWSASKVLICSLLLLAWIGWCVGLSSFSPAGSPGCSSSLGEASCFVSQLPDSGTKNFFFIFTSLGVFWSETFLESHVCSFLSLPHDENGYCLSITKY